MHRKRETHRNRRDKGRGGCEESPSSGIGGHTQIAREKQTNRVRGKSRAGAKWKRKVYIRNI